MTFEEYWEERGHFGCNPEDVARLAWNAALREVARKSSSKRLSPADEQNTAAMRQIVGWIYNEVPINAWGSPEEVKRYVRELQRACADAQDSALSNLIARLPCAGASREWLDQIIADLEDVIETAKKAL